MGLTNKLLISLNDIESRITYFDANIAPQQITYNVLAAQDRYTRDILGDKLYFDLLDNYDPQTNTISTNYETLYEYVKQHLTSRTVERTIGDLHFRITNKGVQTQNSDYSNAASDTNVFRKINQIKSDAEFYEKRLYVYLKNNKTDYPLWKDKSDDINASKPSDDFGIFII